MAKFQTLPHQSTVLLAASLSGKVMIGAMSIVPPRLSRIAQIELGAIGWRDCRFVSGKMLIIENSGRENEC
jgi:hypothetical protein